MTLAKSKGTSLVVPLYSEFDEASTLGPMMAARKGKQAPGNTNGAKTYAPVTAIRGLGPYTSVNRLAVPRPESSKSTPERIFSHRSGL
jgi:hypothetical protein